jgi:hypothetical protein
MQVHAVLVCEMFFCFIFFFFFVSFFIILFFLACFFSHSQEVEAEQYSVFFYPQIANRGYQGLFHSKSRARTMDEYSSRTVDGCCIFWKDAMYAREQRERERFCSFI